ncbi:PAS domain-containing sensor histidine kinase [Yeosuana marina]|uniref:PAS domain-containing sensor histidine kinase n=1 Tax=Yeosuana marina TaxID=1565536 RepID=UPI0014212732|nr:PAS domain-containing sensor histidine kinase [Yeosuana marina]
MVTNNFFLQEETLTHLIKNSFDMIVLLNSEGIQHYVSQSCEKILGFRQDELINIQVIKDMIHPDDQEFVKAEFLAILKNKTTEGVQYRHKHKNGSWVYLETNGSNQLDNPAIKSIVLNVRDITERKITEQTHLDITKKLKELNAAKDKLFSIIGHDLRSPFNSIIGFSELLLDNYKNMSNDELEQYLTIINTSSKSTLLLIDNLLKWAQSQTGKIIYKPEKINVSSTIRDLIETCANAKVKNISINYSQTQDLFVVTDINLITTVIRNLICNAIKFSHINKEIEIYTLEHSNTIEIIISDHGIGMSEHNKNKLFKPDSNFTTLGTNSEKGTGLGLLICKEFVQKLGGKIWVESEEGKGSDFKFTIPLLSDTNQEN